MHTHKDEIIHGLIIGLIVIAGTVLLARLCNYALDKISESEAIAGIQEADLPIDAKQGLYEALKDPEFLEFLKEVA